VTTLVAQVRAELTAGATADAVARRLGMPADLVAGVIAQLTAAGAARCGPTGCPPTRGAAPASCAGCPLLPARGPRALVRRPS